MRSKCAVWAVVLAMTFMAVWANGQKQPSLPSTSHDEPVRRLAEEVRDKGWIVFCARSDSLRRGPEGAVSPRLSAGVPRPLAGANSGIEPERDKGDWDLFLCRPDGSDLQNITRTPQYNEAAPQFSRDGRRLLYRRLPRDEKIDGNQYGAQGELVFANSDGSGTEVFGKSGQYPWASWSPDGRQIACLVMEGIFLVDIASRQTVRRLDRQGFFQQLTWSPDGNWIGGVANSFGTGWSVAQMGLATGTANAVSQVDCCTPDWFPDSRHLIFSNRPPGQNANNGRGWTQLWMADAEGRSRRLVYGEDGRHVYGGHVSPDGKYVVFTGNVQEDGDPGNAGAPMTLMRLADAPVVAGESRQLRALHPGARSGPVLMLPVGWEPCWTFADVNGTAALAAELRDKGWIVFSAVTGKGDWDLFLMRPDGSDRRQIIETSTYNEAGVRFSPDGKKLLYFRLPAAEQIDNNTYGTYELVIANSDGTGAVAYGDGFHWACWGPDSKQIGCLDRKGIQIIDLVSRQMSRQIPRMGIVQQLVWSPDGKWFVGTANGLGVAWTIGCLDADAGQINAVSETDRYNCTPDWLPESGTLLRPPGRRPLPEHGANQQHIIYSRGIVPNTPGWSQLWMASRDGREKRLLYAEDARHIYGGCASPDGQYILFTRSEKDLGKVDDSRTRMAIIRWRDTPMIGGNNTPLCDSYPDARIGPILDLSWGWEPHWTYSDVMSGSNSSLKGNSGRD